LPAEQSRRLVDDTYRLEREAEFWRRSEQAVRENAILGVDLRGILADNGESWRDQEGSTKGDAA